MVTKENHGNAEKLYRQRNGKLTICRQLEHEVWITIMKNCRCHQTSGGCQKKLSVSKPVEPLPPEESITTAFNVNDHVYQT